MVKLAGMPSGQDLLANLARLPPSEVREKEKVLIV